jgi:hypothetical protein
MPQELLTDVLEIPHAVFPVPLACVGHIEGGSSPDIPPEEDVGPDEGAYLGVVLDRHQCPTETKK